MDELVIKISHTIAENKIAVLVGGAGIVLLLYGLLAYGTHNSSNSAMKFEAADSKADTKVSDNQP